MPTALFTKARTAGLVALTLMLAAAGAYPAQASSLKHSFDITIGSGSDRDHRDDCDSRREIKYYFEQKYDLRHIDVSRTHDDDIYKVTGIGDAPKKLQPALSEMKKSDHIRYVFLFDACDHHVKQLQPRNVAEM